MLFKVSEQKNIVKDTVYMHIFVYENDSIYLNFDTTMQNELLRYLSINPTDEEWGIVVTTIGYQFIPPQSPYPLSRHPENYDFSPPNRRTLNEYQLIYITKGGGYFSSESVKMQKIKEGTVLLLFPGEWHSYYPNSDTGWNEFWVGFRGPHIDKRVEKQFFSKNEPIFEIGHSSTLLHLYEEILELAQKEKAGYQQIISSIVLHMLGVVYYKQKNLAFKNSYIENKIVEARQLMKENIEAEVSLEEIASQVGLGYSWFRRMFKEYTGASPAQYQMRQKILRAKELLATTTLNISEIAFRLHFENTGQFSTFFKKKEGITPSDFRKWIQTPMSIRESFTKKE